MGTTVVASSKPDVVVNGYTNFQYQLVGDTSLPDLSNPVDPSANLGPIQVAYVVTFDDTAVSYLNSLAAVNIDLENNAIVNGLGVYINAAVQHGGDAEGDILVDVSRVTGSIYDDVIRGSNASDYDQLISVLNSKYIDYQSNNSERFRDEILNNPGDNILDGGNGNDLLEGRGGADTLNGGLGFDIASYETSPNFIIVQLPGASQTAIARGGDAEGDTFSSIEGLVGSRLNDSLTGNEAPNLLAGGLGSDVLNGAGGTDTADYSNDHFILAGDTADQVVVHLGLNGQSGRGQEFHLINNPLGPPLLMQVSVDTLISIENVTGSNGNDTIVGNEIANVLDGRGGNDVLDGGFGNDTLIGGGGIANTASYLSHDVAAPAGEVSTITLGLNNAPGTYVRSDLVLFPAPAHFQVVETDTLFGIQNVTGSNNTEAINGNELANVLNGRGGDDTVNGRGGDDTLIGGGGNDTLLGGADNDTYLFTTSADGTTAMGADTIFDDSGADKIVVDPNIFVQTRAIGNDLIVQLTTGTVTVVDDVGTHPVETLVLGDKSFTLATGLTGGNSSGIISGTNGNDVMDGGGGDDLLFGNDGNDKMRGGTGNDQLFGGAGNDHLDAGPGNDILNGGSGNNWLIGDAGSDTFVFTPEVLAGQLTAKPSQGAAQDFVEDFTIGQDHIDLTAFHTTFANMTAQQHSGHDCGPVTLTTEGHDTVLAFEGGGSVRLFGVTGLTAHDFLL
jgi:Ca2+-binding RTX toxin-like protein